jgi:hypothetical protein
MLFPLASLIANGFSVDADREGSDALTGANVG